MSRLVYDATPEEIKPRAELVWGGVAGVPTTTTQYTDRANVPAAATIHPPGSEAGGNESWPVNVHLYECCMFQGTAKRTNERQADRCMAVTSRAEAGRCEWPATLAPGATTPRRVVLLRAPMPLRAGALSNMSASPRPQVQMHRPRSQLLALRIRRGSTPAVPILQSAG